MTQGLLMKQPAELHPEVFNLLLQLHAHKISPQDAMAQLIPFLMHCETQEELDSLEPVKEHILAWTKIQE
jgi:hypothetical protein